MAQLRVLQQKESSFNTSLMEIELLISEENSKLTLHSTSIENQRTSIKEKQQQTQDKRSGLMLKKMQLSAAKSELDNNILDHKADLDLINLDILYRH